MHNGGAYGDGTTESGAGIECRAAGTTGKHGQLAFSARGTGDSGADRSAERIREDEPRDRPSVGPNQRYRRQMAATVRRAGGRGTARRATPRAARPISDERVAGLVRKTLETKPKEGTHWSIRQMADQTRISKSTVHRIWQIFGLEPHRQRHFKLSTDPFFVEKVRDIVGLFKSPRKCSGVVCG